MLPERFIGKGEVKGFVFVQRMADPKAFLYEVSAYGRSWYEVFKANPWTKSSKGFAYPGSKSFGRWAWTCRSYEKALEKFNQLTKE